VGHNRFANRNPIIFIQQPSTLDDITQS